MESREQLGQLLFQGNIRFNTEEIKSRYHVHWPEMGEVSLSQDPDRESEREHQQATGTLRMP